MSKKTNPDKKARLKERKEAINLKDSNTDATEELVESEDENRHEEDQQCNPVVCAYCSTVICYTNGVIGETTRNELIAHGMTCANNPWNKRIAELEAQLEWQPIETAPEDGTEVLASGFLYDDPANGRWIEACKFWWSGWVLSSNDSKVYNPTHWMPLPEPPKEQGS